MRVQFDGRDVVRPLGPTIELDISILPTAPGVCWPRHEGIHMARRRMIDPGIWSDPTIGELTIPARLLFIGMLSLADDEGRIDLNVRYLRKEIFGYDDLTVAEVGALLDEIVAQCKNLEAYWADNRQYGVFTTWTRYQRIDRPYRSRLPNPPDYVPASGLTDWAENTHKVKAKQEQPFGEHSTNGSRMISERSTSDPALKERKLKEVKLKETDPDRARAGTAEPAADRNGKEPDDQISPQMQEHLKMIKH